MIPLDKFIKSSKYADGAVGHASGKEDASPIFSIIKAKKSYDIEAINRNNRFACEKEVLLPPNSKYEDITDEISKEEFNGYYTEIRNSILKILKENLGIEDVHKAEEFIGGLKVYNQIS